MKNLKIPHLSTVLFAIVFALLLSPLFGQFVAFAFGAAIILTTWLPMPANVFGLNNTNNISAADSYMKSKRMFFRAFRDKFVGYNSADPNLMAQGDQACQMWVDTLKLSQNEVRCEVQLSNNANTFTFAVLPNQQNTSNIIFNTEKRLTNQDSLCVQEYGLFVGNPSSQSDTTWSLHTYPNTQDFSAADVAALNSTFYSHGWFEMRVNNDVVIPYRGLFNHLYRPQTQQTAALGAASPQDQLRGAEDGFITQEPNIVLIATKGSIPQISLPSNMTIDSEFMRAVVIFRGVLAQNSTVTS